ncbi:DUF5709 domain-containing protein [Streptosporangium sp. NPDC004379]|uniref:DUF5709 domain-containing protein n=1 Tax=Streptosporangium sp. NPDC004379 TaxID=3366189 RepID=UPI00368E9A49
MDRRNMPGDPYSRAEDEGIPDLQEGTPEQQWAVDPQEEPLPADQPGALDDYGTTAEEWSAGEPLDGRLSREEPEPQPLFGTEEGERTGRGEDEAATGEDGLDPDVPDSLDEQVTETSGLGVGSDLNTDYERDEDIDVGYQSQPSGPVGGYGDDEPRQAGRLVEPDQGAATDTEPDMIAEDVGADFGGYTAEEAAMHIEPE